MFAIKQNFGHKRQRTQCIQHLRPFNQNEIEARMTDAQYSSIIWLTQNKYTIVDNEDYDWLSQWRWCLALGYAKRTDRTSGKQISLQMHRVIMNTPRGKETDHIDGNRLNNRKSNLRICNKSQNQRNQGIRADSMSGYKGVAWHKSSNRWMAQIRVGGEHLYLGVYKEAVDAARVYDEAAIKHHGEFAKTNKSLGLI